MGVWDEGKAPRVLKFDIFPSIFLQKKLFSQFRVVKMKFCEFWPPCKNIFGQPLDISVGAGKFLGVRRIFARRPQTCPKSFVWLLLTNFLPLRTFFGVTSKKGFMCFSANVGQYFLNSNNVGRHFFPDFNKSKLLGVRFHSCTTALGKPTFGPCLEKILPAPIFRGTCSSTEMLKGYMARECLGTPVLSKIVLFAWNQTFCPPKYSGWLRHCLPPVSYVTGYDISYLHTIG